MAMATVPVVALFATILLIGIFGDWSSPTLSPLRGVTPEEFASLRLTPAEADAVPAIDESAAIAIGDGREPPGKVRQALLARDLFKGGQLVWVLNFDPKTVVPHLPLGGCYTPDPPEIRVIYSLTVISAATGEFVRGLRHSKFLSEPDCEESRIGQVLQG